MKRILAALLFLAPVQPALAQISLEDLNAEVGKRVETLSTFDDALADSDPRKALAAMQIMIERGDADQRRMAIRSGLYSTDLAMRATVLRAILNSAPNLIFEIKPVGDEVNQYYGRAVGNFSGTVKPDNSASVIRKVGKWDEEKQCWDDSTRQARCIVTLNADVVSVFLDSWAQLRLDNTGRLTGPANFSQTPVELTISLAE